MAYWIEDTTAYTGWRKVDLIDEFTDGSGLLWARVREASGEYTYRRSWLKTLTEVNTIERARAFPAKFTSKCNTCTEKIEIGMLVRFRTGLRGVCHIDCFFDKK